MRTNIPINVMLRCKQRARVTAVSSDVWPYFLQGRTPEGTHELWHRDGHWREDKSPHAFDIVAIVTSEGELLPITDQFSSK